MEILYRVYVGAIFGGSGLVLLAGVIEDSHVNPQGVVRITEDGPALLGLAISLLLLAALRMGARGGPLAIQDADVQHVLLAPIDRGWALRPLAIRQLRTALFVGVVCGLIVANFAFRRLPGSPLEWLGCLALFGGLTALWTPASALLASGRRLRPRAANLIGLGIFGWSLTDYLAGATTSPLTMLGALATLPMQRGVTAYLALVGITAVGATVFFGLRSLGRLSLEAARRRAGLAAELRFAATVQDLRTVVLLRRELAAERPRQRPWRQLGFRVFRSQPIVRRGWQSFLRWPAQRLGRIIAIGIGVGLLLTGAWSGTTPLLAVAGLILLVAGFDVIEPLAEESDHPTRRDLLPTDPARLTQRHLIAPTMLMTVVTLMAALAAAALGESGLALSVGAVMFFPTALLITCCAAISATNDPYTYYTYIFVPQVGYVQTGLPITLATGALAIGGIAGPAWAAREAARHHHSAVAAAGTTELGALIACLAMIWWLGRRVASRVEVQP